MSSWKARQRRKEAVKRRAVAPSSMFKNCRVIGCKKPARAATEDGLDTRFCRAHADQLSRHGSAYRKSYTAAELAPYRRAAMSWLKAHEGDRSVANAIQRVRGLYDRAGPHVEAFRLRGMTPRQRANAAWARLRKAGVDPRKVVTVWFTIEAATRDMGDAESKLEFRRVQAAKLVHRLASGSHRKWSQGAGGPTELHVYPASRGQVLRHVGQDIENAVELLAARCVDEIVRLKRSTAADVSMRLRAK